MYNSRLVPICVKSRALGVDFNAGERIKKERNKQHNRIYIKKSIYGLEIDRKDRASTCANRPFMSCCCCFLDLQIISRVVFAQLYSENDTSIFIL